MENQGNAEFEELVRRIEALLKETNEISVSNFDSEKVIDANEKISGKNE